MKGVAAHAAFLVVALLAALLAWTAGEDADDSSAPIEVWAHDADDLREVVFRSGDRSVRIERRNADGESYLWGTESLADTAGAPSESFPAGEGADAMVADLATLRALRDLGAADDERRAAFGLLEPQGTITLRFDDGTERVLALGNSVVGDGHRYALDTQTDRIYVLPAGLVRPIEVGGGALRLTQIQPFDPDDVATATVAGGGVDRTMERRVTGVPPQAIWVHPGTDRLDQTFTNFMDQLESLWVLRYDAAVATDTLRALMRTAYVGERGDTLGVLELFRSDADSLPRYFLRTRRTIVPGEVHSSIAERVEQDLQTLRSAGDPTGTGN